MIRSFHKLMSVDTGFEAAGVVAAYFPLPMERNPEPVKLAMYIERILEQVRALPGVGEAAAIPMRGWGSGMPFRMARVE